MRRPFDRGGLTQPVRLDSGPVVIPVFTSMDIRISRDLPGADLSAALGGYRQFELFGVVGTFSLLFSDNHVTFGPEGGSYVAQGNSEYRPQ